MNRHLNLGKFARKKGSERRWSWRFTVTQSDVRFLRGLGKGSASEGIALLVAQARATAKAAKPLKLSEFD